jgi:hypothetical protein
MLLGFKRRFAPYVEEGSKTHTIRGYRLNPVRVGEICHCYVDPRQKSMRLLGRSPCVRVQGIRIYEARSTHSVVIDGCELTDDEMNALAWRDGFRDRGPHYAFQSMAAFWDGRLPFNGVIIHWDYFQPLARSLSKPRAFAAARP